MTFHRYNLRTVYASDIKSFCLLLLILPCRYIIVLLGDSRNFELAQRGTRYVPVRLTEHSHRVTRFNLSILSVHQLWRESYHMACRAKFVVGPVLHRIANVDDDFWPLDIWDDRENTGVLLVFNLKASDSILKQESNISSITVL